MRLHRSARKYFTLDITTSPAISAWELSVDGGSTWVAATLTGDSFSWLISGPDFDPTTAPDASSMAVAGTVKPLLRATDYPEVLVEDAPMIILTS